MVETDCDTALLLLRAARHLCAARRVVALTGAGISAESGIPTYRDVVARREDGGGRAGSTTGLWKKTAALVVFGTPLGFLFRPDQAWRLYCERLLLPIAHAQPNQAHRALAELAATHASGECPVITQNVDGLHQRAGSEWVLELHGTIATHRHAWTGAAIDIGDPQRCNPSQPPAPFARPDVTLFGESMPPAWWEAEALVSELGAADVLLVVGTSLKVAPAATLPEIALMRGCHVIEINVAPVLSGDSGDSWGGGVTALRGPAGLLLPALVASLAVQMTACSLEQKEWQPCTSRAVESPSLAQLAQEFDRIYRYDVLEQ
jgi:NAD-dependent deacetylase|eukprot:COSAG01_NODE_1617_length_9718_cov_267.124545_2_plen_319_part_00